MVADITQHPAALAARDFFKSVVAETIKMMETVKSAATGLAGVVGQGVRDFVSSTIPAQFTPAVAVAHDPPDRGGRGTA